MARSSFSPARNVRSNVVPVLTFFMRVRTNAEPFPGLTCRNSMTVQSWPSTTMVTPLRRSFDEIMVAHSTGCSEASPGGWQTLLRAGESNGPSVPARNRAIFSRCVKRISTAAKDAVERFGNRARKEPDRKRRERCCRASSRPRNSASAPRRRASLRRRRDLPANRARRSLQTTLRRPCRPGSEATAKNSGRAPLRPQRTPRRSARPAVSGSMSR